MTDTVTDTRPMMRALAGEALPVPPVWMMRQAGRYLPEYRAVRARAASFLDLCYTPELATEVTLQPIRRYGFDAAILFADILLVPHALGADLVFIEGEGPRLSTVTSPDDLARLRPADAVPETLAPVYATVRAVRAALPPQVPLIGFAGAPWTVATYMVAGRATPDQAPARLLAYRDPATFDALIERITEATIGYLLAQVEAGAEIVKLFDSWAGALPGPLFARYAIAPARRIADALRAAHPGVPVIGFPRGAGAGYAAFAAGAGVQARRPRHLGRPRLGGGARCSPASASRATSTPSSSSPAAAPSTRRPAPASAPSPAARTSSTSATASPPRPTPPTSSACSGRIRGADLRSHPLNMPAPDSRGRPRGMRFDRSSPSMQTCRQQLHGTLTTPERWATCGARRKGDILRAAPPTVAASTWTQARSPRPCSCTPRRTFPEPSTFSRLGWTALRRPRRGGGSPRPPARPPAWSSPIRPPTAFPSADGVTVVAVYRHPLDLFFSLRKHRPT